MAWLGLPPEPGYLSPRTPGEKGARVGGGGARADAQPVEARRGRGKKEGARGTRALRRSSESAESAAWRPFLGLSGDLALLVRSRARAGLDLGLAHRALE